MSSQARASGLRFCGAAVGGPHDRGPFPISVSTSAHCASFPRPPKSSDHGERQHFLFPKSLSPKKERKLLSAGFIWKKRGFGDQQGKKTQKTFYCNEHIKREVLCVFFSFAFCWNWADKSPEMRKSRGAAVISTCLMMSLFVSSRVCLSFLLAVSVFSRLFAV